MLIITSKLVAQGDVIEKRAEQLSNTTLQCMLILTSSIVSALLLSWSLSDFGLHCTVVNGIVMSR